MWKRFFLYICIRIFIPNKNINRTIAMGVISLKNMEFKGYHGCLPEERIIGTKYVIDVSFDYDSAACEQSDNLNDAVNYAEVYEIIKQQFSQPVNLIEHLAKNIGDGIKQASTKIHNVEVVVTKFNPPIPDFNGYVKYTYVS